jgi:response regulator RpfG family c-di-GMP phosphodiesterase
MIVDDVATDGLYLSALIGDTGHDVINVESPVVGLREAENQNPSLVVVDYMLPEFDGVEFIRRLRTMDRHRETPVLMVTTTDRKPIRLAALEAGAIDVLLKPVDPVEWRARIRNLLRLCKERQTIEEYAAALRHDISKAKASLFDREVEIIVRLSRAAEYRDPVAADHVMRAASIARYIARTLRLEDWFCDRIYLAMQMHDVGKLCIPDAILDKPGPLTKEERATMEKHVFFGVEILKGSSSELIRMGEEIALTHHERWNGTGYPNGLSGNEIPLCGRIAAVADVYDALTSWRPYKPAWSAEAAIDHMRQEAGRLFDPACVAAMLEASDGLALSNGSRERSAFTGCA